MNALGYTEGKNLLIEWRFADGEIERLPALAAELVNLKVDVMVAGGTPVISAAKEATSTIPIVMATSNDPLGSKFVTSLGQPGGNVTGLSIISTDLSPKVVEILRTIAPTTSRIAVLTNPKNDSNAEMLRRLQMAIHGADATSIEVEAATKIEIENGFLKSSQRTADSLIVAADSEFVEQRDLIARLALKHRLPSMFSFREHVEAGGLISYGQNLSDSFRRAATFVDKIFKGARAGDLPVEQSTKLELVINSGTARTLGLTAPLNLLALADDVIE